MNEPVYRIAAVWLAVKNARLVGSELVALCTPEELAAARALKSIKVCECSGSGVPHIHTKGAWNRVN